jgi:acyl dehydratase
MVGARAQIRRTVTESAVELYCGLTGDLDPLHVDEEFARATQYGRRVAPGGLVVGYMMAAAAQAAAGVPSLGFDRLRHTAPVFFGDTVSTTYEVTAFDPATGRGHAAVTCTNQHGDTVAVADHVFKVVA